MATFFPNFLFSFSFFFFNFLSFVLFCFLELIMFCQWLHAKYLATQYQNISWPKNFEEYVFMLSLLLLPSFWLLFVLMLVACTVVLFFILSKRILLFHCCPVKLLEIRNCISFFFYPFCCSLIEGWISPQIFFTTIQTSWHCVGFWEILVCNSEGSIIANFNFKPVLYI